MLKRVQRKELNFVSLLKVTAVMLFFLCAKLFLEVFGGSCRLTSAARLCDLNASAWDVLMGPQFDLSKQTTNDYTS